MRFSIEPTVFARFPGLHIVAAVATGLDNAAPHPSVSEQWRVVWQRAGSDGAIHGNAQSHPRVRPWREHFQAMGVSGKQFPSSIEALLRRAMKGGEPFSINPLVDFYNTLSLRHTVPAGAFDLRALDTAVDLRLSRAGDSFTALDDAEPIDIPPGEVSYAQGTTILTRHFVWRQSRTGLVASQTRDILFVSEILGELGPRVAEQLATDLRDGLRRHFNSTADVRLLDEAAPTAEW